MTIAVARTAELTDTVRRDVRALLDEAFSGEFTDDDWAHTLGGWHVVVRDGGAVVSHAAVVPRLLEVGGAPWHTGYVEGVGTAAGRRREGLGSRAMARLNAIIRAEFELGALSTDAHRFYERLGWERWHGPTFVRRAGSIVRTADEDAGIMVLRTSASRDLKLAQSISCEARAGDDW